MISCAEGDPPQVIVATQDSRPMSFTEHNGKSQGYDRHISEHRPDCARCANGREQVDQWVPSTQASLAHLDVQGARGRKHRRRL